MQFLLTAGNRFRGLARLWFGSCTFGAPADGFDGWFFLGNNGNMTLGVCFLGFTVRSMVLYPTQPMCIPAFVVFEDVYTDWSCFKGCI